MNTRPQSARAGWALLETLLASTLLMIFAGSAVVMSNAVTSSFRVEMTAMDFDVRGHQAFTEVIELLRCAHATSVLPALIEAPGSSPWVEFQRTAGFDGDVVLGSIERITVVPDPGDPPDGLDNDGDGIVDEGELILIENEGLANERRRRICGGVAPSLDGEILGNGVDDNGNALVDEPGFCVVFDGEVVTVYLSLDAGTGFGERSRTTAECSVSLRNAR